MAIDEVRLTPAQLSPVWKKLSTGSASEPGPSGEPETVTGSGVDGAASPEVLSPAEQDFFEKLFPEAQQSVKTYSLRGQDGSSAGSNKGILLDRKG
jgi:hypothetical protein